MGLGSRLRDARRLLAQQGPLHTTRYAMGRFVEERYERRFGIHTAGQIYLEALGISNEDSVRYAPASYGGFFKAMRHVPDRTGAFVDYGSGLGRILAAASAFPFKRITGIELSSALVERCRGNLGSRPVDLVCCDAAAYTVSNDVTVFHFYNPFHGETLRAVVHDIRRSLIEAPRRAWIVFAFPWYFEPLISTGEIIPRAWLRRSNDEYWPFHIKQNPADELDGLVRVYEVDSTA